MGLWKGKKGSSVFYKIWNSNNKEKQGIREYVPEISNPQTNAQADQRMRMLPAQLVKGALRDIVSRSFQGVPYGAKSRLEFIKYALRAEVYPYIPKGFTDPVPGEYLISRGTLQSVGCVYVSEEPGFILELKYAGEYDPGDLTFGQLSANLIENNDQLEEGDQITFVVCLVEGQSQNLFNYYYTSFVLDPGNNQQVSSDPGFVKTSFRILGNRVLLSGDQDNACAAACIVSRLGSDGQYMRSTARLVVNTAGFPTFYGEASRATTRASYQTKTTRGSYDWPVEQTEGTGTITLIAAPFTLSGLTSDLAQLNGRQVAVQVAEGSNVIRRVFIDSQDQQTGYLVDMSGNRLQITGTGGEVTYLTQVQVPALRSYPTAVWGD